MTADEIKDPSKMTLITRLNGQELGSLWLAPWRIDITAAVRPGQNTLVIVVVNAWDYRLATDASLPADKRHTFLARDTLAKNNAPLLPAGLLGPVTVQSATLIHLERP